MFVSPGTGEEGEGRGGQAQFRGARSRAGWAAMKFSAGPIVRPGGIMEGTAPGGLRDPGRHVEQTAVARAAAPAATGSSWASRRTSPAASWAAAAASRHTA